MGGLFSVPLEGLPADAASAGEVRGTEFMILPNRVLCESYVVPATPRCVYALNSLLTKVRTVTTARLEPRGIRRC